MSLPLAVALVLICTLIALRARVVSPSGAMAGAVIALMLAFSPTPAPFAVFVLFVFAGSASSRLGRERKVAFGAAQEDEGRRSAVHAIANTGCAAAVVLLGMAVNRPVVADVAACAALAAVLSDTVAGEWGMWLGSRPRDILTLRRVEPGTDGGVTITGLAAALAAAVAAGGVACAFHRSSASFVAVAAGGFTGNLVDSVLGSSVESSLGRHANAIVNAAASVAGAACGWALVAGEDS